MKKKEEKNIKKRCKRDEEIIEIIENTGMESKKSNIKLFLIIGGVIVIITLIVGLLFYFNRLKKEDVIRRELEAINEKMEVDEKIKSKGELKIVEEAVKKYYVDYFAYKKIVNETRTDALANLLTPKYLNDNRKKLANTKKKFNEQKKLFDENIDKMIEMFSEDKILSYLDKSKISKKDYNFYKELMIADGDKETLNNIKKFKESNEEKFKYLEELIDVMSKEASSWYIKDDKLYIDTDYTLKKYNELRTRIYNLDKSTEV